MVLEGAETTEVITESEYDGDGNRLESTHYYLDGFDREITEEEFRAKFSALDTVGTIYAEEDHEDHVTQVYDHLIRILRE